jgi:hypothetical protein
LEWRNCPRSDGYSPSEAFLGRRLRGRLPVLSSGFGQFDCDRFKMVRDNGRDKVAS